MIFGYNKKNECYFIYSSLFTTMNPNTKQALIEILEKLV
jgi:hypothetical protein